MIGSSQGLHSDLPAPLGDRASPPDPDSGVSTTGGSSRRRELDLRRTEAPDPGGMPAVRRRHLRRYGVAVFDADGRITDQVLFALLGFTAGTRVEIGVDEGHAVVVRRTPAGRSVLTRRNMVLVPAGIRRWCGFGAREQVLLVAVPALSALVIHGLEKLDLALPDPQAVVTGMHPPGGPSTRAQRVPVRAARGEAASEAGRGGAR